MAFSFILKPYICTSIDRPIFDRAQNLYFEIILRIKYHLRKYE